MERLFVDTSAWFAYTNRADPEHRAVRDTLRKAAGRLVTSNFVFDETVTLCRYRLGHKAAAEVGAVLREHDAIDLVRVGADDEREAWNLFCNRTDKAYSFTDCTSFVLMRRLKLARAVALDDDFRQEGFEALP
jgi:uncharacterized protein